MFNALLLCLSLFSNLQGTRLLRPIFDERGLNPVPPSDGIVMYFQATVDECAVVIENQTPTEYTVHKEDISAKSIRFLTEYPDKDVWYDVKFKNVFDGVKLLPGSSYAVPFKQVCPQPVSSVQGIIYFVRIVDNPNGLQTTIKHKITRITPHALGDGAEITFNSADTKYERDIRRYICVVVQSHNVTDRIERLLLQHGIGAFTDRGVFDATYISPVEKLRALKILRSDPDIMKSKIRLVP